MVESRAGPAADLLRLPGVGRFLRWRHARTALGLPLLVLAGLLVLDGLLGPQTAPKNLATVLTWVHFRGLAILVLLLLGNLFCLGCPFMVTRNVARRWLRPRRAWPRALRNKWLSAGLFAALLFAYELFDLWASPRWTAWLIVAYFAGAVVVDSLFRGASFCKYVCPLGQFNMLVSTLSPFEIKIRRQAVCDGCHTKDCIRGRPGRRGCELGLYQGAKVGNLDCTFCLDCVHACPPQHDNVGIEARLPASELWIDAWRAGVGRLAHRADLAALAVVLTFGALANAFGMVSPVYAVQDWLAAALHTRSEALVLGLIFLGVLVLLPAMLLGGAAWLSERLAGQEARRRPDRPAVLAGAVRYAWALLPLGAATWLAHYSFHFFTGFWTFVPVVQSFVAETLGQPLLGSPRWALGPLLPEGWLLPLELGSLGLGWLGSLLVAYRLAEQQTPERAGRAWAPWAALATLLLAAAVWLMSQPMEMRGVMWGG